MNPVSRLGDLQEAEVHLPHFKLAQQFCSEDSKRCGHIVQQAVQSADWGTILL
jgi:hypothetical protein